MTQPDPFQDARSGFVRLDDLKGRLLLVYPVSSEERPSTLRGQENKNYLSITCDVIVLDGKPTDMIEEIPLTLSGIFFAGMVLENQLKPSFRLPPDKRFVLGRLAQVTASRKGMQDRWELQAPTDEDKAIARDPANEYLGKNIDPFATAQ